MERAPRRAMMMLRFWRPVFHMALIVLSFWVMYEVRQTTDLIPFVQLRIPALNLRETMLFAVCSAGAFVVIGIIRGLYELFRPLHRYYTVFLESWLIWVVVSSAIAYYGFGYVFVSGGLSMVVSAGNPTGYGSAKKTLTGAIFGLVLVFVAFVLVNTLLAGSLSLGIKNGTSIFTSPSGYIQGPSSGGDSPTK
jgi:hypothetical protein